MPWIKYPDVDDTIHDWLKTGYTPYRDTLSTPKPIPAEDNIDWDSYWAGTNPTSFMVVEELTEHPFLALGAKTVEFRGVQRVRISYRWIGAGKPPELKEIREYVTKTIHQNISPLPTVLRNAGIYWMMVLDSRIFLESRSAQEDFWVLEVRLATKVLNNTV